MIVDGQAHVVALDKPPKARTFGDLADSFATSIIQAGEHFKCTHIVFDRYYDLSIKSSTRTKRAKKSVPVRREIRDRDVPLPLKWENFMASEENKADLARFLSHQLMFQAPQNKTVVVAGGFTVEKHVETSTSDANIEELEARHEEADTRMVLHCTKSQASVIVVASRDTDVLVLLLAHFASINCDEVWMKAGTLKKQKFIPIHTVAANLGDALLRTLPAFHAITGCDTTSFLAGHSKKSCFKVFMEHHNLLKELGRGDLSNTICANVEAFICKVFKAGSCMSSNSARASLFAQGVPLETLPPSHDALSFHIKRAHYQASVWLQANQQRPALPPPETMGWQIEKDALLPVLTSLPSLLQTVITLVTCGCTTQCQRKNCNCKKHKLQCTAACFCHTSGDVCRNKTD